MNFKFECPVRWSKLVYKGCPSLLWPWPPKVAEVNPSKEVFLEAICVDQVGALKELADLIFFRIRRKVLVFFGDEADRCEEEIPGMLRKFCFWLSVWIAKK